MNPTVGALLGLVGVLAGAAVTWLIARRKASGSVATTEANVLWDQAKEFWDSRAAELTADLIAIKAEVVSLRRELVTLGADAKLANEEIRVLREKLRETVGAAMTTRGQVDVVEQKVAKLENGT